MDIKNFKHNIFDLVEEKDDLEEFDPSKKLIELDDETLKNVLGGVTSGGFGGGGPGSTGLAMEDVHADPNQPPGTPALTRSP